MDCFCFFVFFFVLYLKKKGCKEIKPQFWGKRKNYGVVNGSSFSPISSHIWNMTFSSRYRILERPWSTGVCQIGVNMMVCTYTQQHESYSWKTQVVAGRRLEGHKIFMSYEGLSCWRGVRFVLYPARGQPETNEAGISSV